MKNQATFYVLKCYVIQRGQEKHKDKMIDKRRVIKDIKTFLTSGTC